MSSEPIAKVEYSGLQRAYDQFNRALFEGRLPGALITLQRKNRAAGFYCFENFVARDGGRRGSADEIALNPDAFAGFEDTEVMQILVHEMAHQWQFHYGSPGRREIPLPPGSTWSWAVAPLVVGWERGKRAASLLTMTISQLWHLPTTYCSCGAAS